MFVVHKRQWPVLIVNAVATAMFALLFFERQNYEFIAYIGVIIFFFGVLLYTNKHLNYPNSMLWGLTIWSIMHMAGGSVHIGDGRLYEVILLNLIGEPYNVFRYDQLVHIVGFGAATVVMRYLLSSSPITIRTGIVIVMAGLGVGALNEIVEFGVVLVVPEAGVGGYENTLLDLVSNLIGAVGAVVILAFAEKRKNPRALDKKEVHA